MNAPLPYQSPDAAKRERRRGALARLDAASVVLAIAVLAIVCAFAAWAMSR